MTRRYAQMPSMPDLNYPYNSHPHRAGFPFGRYGGYNEDPEAQRPAAAHDPFLASTQDIPLLHRLPTEEDLRARAKAQAPVLQYIGPGQYSSGTNGPTHRGSPYISIPLVDGNLVIDCPVPPKLAKRLPVTNSREFLHTRYTAATCDPAEFTNNLFHLRQQIDTIPRKTELLIVVTMYDEDDVLFANTMAGVFKNINYMCQGDGKVKGPWGLEGWKKIVVLIVSDGRKQLNPRTASALTALGVYQPDVLNGKEAINGKPVTAHIFEHTSRVGINVENGIVETYPGEDSITPVQMIFCLKERNEQKINSHRWALQAFGKALLKDISSVVVLLDAGTEPGSKSIYELYRAFELDKHCGGACGEIKVDLGKYGANLWKNPLVATQNFEYKMSNILDKPMESAFGFISVLPGAFSAYRFKALQDSPRGLTDRGAKGPLQKYFFGEEAHASGNIFTKNMYLAEDRILCFELISKRNEAWVLTYVKSATGKTDVPDQMSKLVKQRRRWLNGSFFAAVYALTHFYQIFRSSHSVGRKIAFLVEFLFQFVSMIFSWFAIGNFFLVFHILATSLGQEELLGRPGQIVSVILEWIYLGSLATCFVLSFGNRPDGTKRFYLSMVWTWGGIMGYMLFAAVFISVRSVQEQLVTEKKFVWTKLLTNQIFFTLIVSLLSTYVLWIVASIIFMDPWHIVTSSLQYLILSPTYTNVINVYAFCNVHDVTWGTRDAPKEEKGASVDSKDGKVEVSMGLGDLNVIYDSALQDISCKEEKIIKKSSVSELKLKATDDYAAFRSYVVLSWMFCNAALVAIVLNEGGLNRLMVQNRVVEAGKPTAHVIIYLKVVLWSVASLSGFKFIGAMVYIIKRFFVH